MAVPKKKLLRKDQIEVIHNFSIKHVLNYLNNRSVIIYFLKIKILLIFSRIEQINILNILFITIIKLRVEVYV